MSRPAREARLIDGITHHCCAQCKGWFPVAHFYGNGKGSVHSWCRPCYLAWRTIRRASWPCEQGRRSERPRTPPQASTCPETSRLQAGFLRLRSPRPAGFMGRPLLQGGVPA